MQLEWDRFTLYKIMIVLLASVVMNLVSNESVFGKNHHGHRCSDRRTMGERQVRKPWEQQGIRWGPNLSK